MLSSELPRDCRAAMAATDTRAAIRPYSMAVAPDSSVRKDLMVVIMIATSYARISEANIRPCALRNGKTKARKSVVSGKSVSVRVDLGGRRIIKKKKQIKSK